MLLIDGGEGCPQFVRYLVDEIGLHFVQFLEGSNVMEYGDSPEHFAVRSIDKGRQGAEVNSTPLQLLGNKFSLISRFFKQGPESLN
jgi:hypothetical protein